MADAEGALKKQRQTWLKTGNAKLDSLSARRRLATTLCCFPCMSPLVMLPTPDRGDFSEVVKDRAKAQKDLKVYDGFTSPAHRFLYKWPDRQQLLEGKTLDTVLASGKIETSAATARKSVKNRGIFGFTLAQNISRCAAQEHLKREHSSFVFERADRADATALVQAWQVHVNKEFASAFKFIPPADAPGFFHPESLIEFKMMLGNLFGIDNVQDADIFFCKINDDDKENNAENNCEPVLVGTPQQLTQFLNSNPDLRLHYYKLQNKDANRQGITVQIKNRCGDKSFQYSGQGEHALYTRISHQSMTMIQEINQFMCDKTLGNMVQAGEAGHEDYRISVKRSDFDLKDGEGGTIKRFGAWPLPGAEEINISFIKILGRGQFGTVVQVEVTDTRTESEGIPGVTCALKMTELRKNDNFDDDECERARERTALFEIAKGQGAKRNPFIVQGFFEVKLPNRSWMLKNGSSIKRLNAEAGFPNQTFGAGLLIEFAAEGSLEAYVIAHSNSSTPMDLDVNWLSTGRRFSAEMIAAVSYLHAQQIVHRDLKPENMLLKMGSEGELHICLTDFGTAKRYSNSSIHTMAKGTEHYAAPEVPRPGTQNKPYTQKCDVYSLGVTVNVVFQRAKRFHTGHGGEWTLIANTELHPTYPTELRSLITEMTENDPECRPSFAVLKEHTFYKRITSQVQGKEIISEVINWDNLASTEVLAGATKLETVLEKDETKAR